MKKLITFLFITMVATTACSQERNMITEQRNVGAYSEVEISGIYAIVLTEGKVGELTVEAPENLMENIETKVRGNGLKSPLRVPLVCDEGTSPFRCLSIN